MTTRLALHNEIHARPYQTLPSPCVILHWVYSTIGQDAKSVFSHVAELLADHHLPAPQTNCNHLHVSLGNFQFRWEKHTEFVTYTFWRPTSSDQALFDVIPQQWLDRAVGVLMAAIEVRIHANTSIPETFITQDPQIIRSSVMGQKATITTDYQIKSNGFSFWDIYTLENNAIGDVQLGRLVQQTLEIETYRMMGLLGLPAARAVGAQLGHLETELVHISKAIGTADKSQEPALLELLTQLASQVESLYATHHTRFSATQAYMDLVDQRLNELDETAISQYPTLRTFLTRRLTPATQTCAWTNRRLQALSERISRNSNLLRTRVEVEQQEHHKALLSTMTSRQLSQLRLQTTVEGISTVAISYYTVGLVSYLAKAAQHYGWPFSVEMTTAVTIPFVIVAVYIGLKRMKHHISVD